MSIDWNALGTVFAVGLLVTVGLVGLFTLGVNGLTRQEEAVARGGSAPLAMAGAYLCFACAAAAVAYGIYLIAG